MGLFTEKSRRKNARPARERTEGDIRLKELHGRFLRSHGFSMQNSANGRKRNVLGLTGFILVNNVLQKCAKPRKNSFFN
jgi:hypothetical protein